MTKQVPDNIKAVSRAKEISAAVDMLKQAQRPIIVSSNGVFYSRAWDALKTGPEKADIPVVVVGAQ
ncbi:MAG: hypothetical protein IPJ07_09005 [Acidobacteria bacterium]|nr:hypothetical protein [Acidobacteriota bacterium]